MKLLLIGRRLRSQHLWQSTRLSHQAIRCRDPSRVLKSPVCPSI
jgi:hypothetical protein